MKVKSIYKYLKPVKRYNDLFGEIVKEGAERWEERVKKLAFEFSKKQLADRRELFDDVLSVLS